MKIRSSVLRRWLPAPALACALALCFAYLTPANKLWSASAQVTSPNGSYGILLNQWKDPNSNNVSALLGVVNFDGAGNISGSYTIVSKNPVMTGTLTGTYAGNPDGSNSANLTFDIGATMAASVAVTDGGTGLQLIVNGGSLTKPGQVISGTGRIQSAQGTSPAGSYGYLLNQWPDANNGPSAIFGVFNLDGAGNITGSYTIVGSAGPNPLSGSLTGTYTVNPDGTGSTSVSLDVGVSVKQAIVVVDGGSGIQMLQTSTTGGGNVVISGTARMQ
ncbi:MAG TPA: hypothetical protein VEV17_06695 [Bryobacteraceae bacterium]|nr:hypothetical protein [Bryobacteraceae bacterium]